MKIDWLNGNLRVTPDDETERLALQVLFGEPTQEQEVPTSSTGTAVGRTAEEIDAHWEEWRTANPEASLADWQEELKRYLTGK